MGRRRWGDRVRQLQDYLVFSFIMRSFEFQGVSGPLIIGQEVGALAYGVSSGFVEFATNFRSRLFVHVIALFVTPTLHNNNMASKLLAVATSNSLSLCDIEKDGSIVVKTTTHP